MILNRLIIFIFLGRSADAELEKIRRFNCILLKAVKIFHFYILLFICIFRSAFQIIRGSL